MADRDARWTTLQEEKYLSRLNLTGRTVVLDCVTLWLTSFFADAAYDVETTLREARAEFDKLRATGLYPAGCLQRNRDGRTRAH